MKRPFLVLIILLAVSGAQAQSSYVGLLSGSGITPFNGVQVGAPVAKNNEGAATFFGTLSSGVNVHF